MGQRIIVKNADYSKASVGKVDLISANILDEDVSAYIAAVTAADNTFNSQLYTIPTNILVKKLKLFGIWNRLDVLHLFLGLTPISQGFNLINKDENKVLFFPKSNGSSTETIAKFTTEGYEAHNKTSGSNITYNNIAVFDISAKMKSHPSDIFFAISGFVKPDDAGNTSNTFTAGNLTTDGISTIASNRAIMGVNLYSGIGFISPPFTPSFSYSTIEKRMFSYSLSNMKMKTFQGAIQLQEITAGPLEISKLSRPNFGIGHATSSVPSVVNNVLQNVNYNAAWGQCNFTFDSLIWGRSLSQQDISVLNTILNEFRTSIGRSISA